MAAEPGASRQEPVQEPTGLPLATLQWVGRSICRSTADFRLHPEVQQLFESRRCGCAPPFLPLIGLTELFL
jgi:hypothetical protein